MIPRLPSPVIITARDFRKGGAKAIEFAKTPEAFSSASSRKRVSWTLVAIVAATGFTLRSGSAARNPAHFVGA
jgi:hypothetical protein